MPSEKFAAFFRDSGFRYVVPQYQQPDLSSRDLPFNAVEATHKRLPFHVGVELSGHADNQLRVIVQARGWRVRPCPVVTGDQGDAAYSVAALIVLRHRPRSSGAGAAAPDGPIKI